MITGSGQVNLLSGQIWRYRVGFGSATRCAPVNLLGRAGRARAGRPAGPSRIQIINYFFFFKSIL
jgi:hypothetical protein